MKNFLAVYIGTMEDFEKSGWGQLSEAERKEKEEAGMAAWGEWMEKHKEAIVDIGAPLGKTKSISSNGIEDTKNNLSGYIIVKAESHEAAAKMFEDHAHFSIFPGKAVEVMACLDMPGA